MLRPGPDSFFTDARVVNGSVQLSLIGVPGRTYTVEGASNLLSPQWTFIGNVTVPAYLGSAQFTDVPNDARRFYRLRYP